MKMIQKAGAEVIRADRVHQEEGRVQEASAHQKAVGRSSSQRGRSSRNDDVDEQFDDMDYEEFD